MKYLSSGHRESYTLVVRKRYMKRMLYVHIFLCFFELLLSFIYLHNPFREMGAFHKIRELCGALISKYRVENRMNRRIPAEHSKYFSSLYRACTLIAEPTVCCAPLRRAINVLGGKAASISPETTRESLTFFPFYF